MSVCLLTGTQTNVHPAPTLLFFIKCRHSNIHTLFLSFFAMSKAAFTPNPAAGKVVRRLCGGCGGVSRNYHNKIHCVTLGVFALM